MKRTISTTLAAILLTAGGQALAAGPPVAPVELNAGLGCSAQCIEQAPVTATVAHLIRFRDGRAVQVRGFPDREAALRAAATG